MITAIQSEVGKSYKTSHGIAVEIIKKMPDGRVIVKSSETGHLIPIPPDYELSEMESIVMENVTPSELVTATVVAEARVKKLKKSNVVDDGLVNNLTTDEIVEAVQNHFPETTPKSIRNLISVRRSKLKKVSTN